MSVSSILKTFWNPNENKMACNTLFCYLHKSICLESRSALFFLVFFLLVCYSFPSAARTLLWAVLPFASLSENQGFLKLSSQKSLHTCSYCGTPKVEMVYFQSPWNCLWEGPYIISKVTFFFTISIYDQFIFYFCRLLDCSGY